MQITVEIKQPKPKTVLHMLRVPTCRVLISSFYNTFFLFKNLLQLVLFIELSIPMQNTVVMYYVAKVIYDCDILKFSSLSLW